MYVGKIKKIKTRLVKSLSVSPYSFLKSVFENPPSLLASFARLLIEEPPTYPL